jgi:hypothetical protein
MIRWRAAIEPGTAGLLWSEAVAAEIGGVFRDWVMAGCAPPHRRSRAGCKTRCRSET